MNSNIVYKNGTIKDLLYKHIENLIDLKKYNYDEYFFNDNDSNMCIYSKHVKYHTSVCYNDLKVILTQIQYLENIFEYNNFISLIFDINDIFYIELNEIKIYFIKPSSIFPIIDNKIHISSDLFQFPDMFKKGLNKSDIYPFSPNTMEIFNKHKKHDEYYFTISICESYHSLSVVFIKLLCNNNSKSEFKKALIKIKGTPIYFTLIRSLNMEKFIYL
jgi:hypothetical protein